MRTSAGVQYLPSDALGSTSLATDGSGALVGSPTRYYPYGATRSGGSGLPTEYRFTGQRREPGLGGLDGLYFYNARWYDPYLNRFVQPDSIVPQPGNPQDLNRYSYTRNNPLKFVDPTGHSCVFVNGQMDCSEAGAVTGSNTLTVDANVTGSPNQISSPMPAAVLNIGVPAYDPDAPIQDTPDPSTPRPPSETEVKIWRTANWFWGAVGGIGGPLAALQNPGSANEDVVMPSGQAVMGAQSPQNLVSAALRSNSASGLQSFQSFDSFTALKRAWGPAGNGKVWHHIVEQRGVNVQRFGARAINNTYNVVAVDQMVNQTIANYYSSIQSFTHGQTVRAWLTPQSYNDQFAFGQSILQAVLNGQPLP